MITDKTFTKEQFIDKLKELGKKVSQKAQADVNIIQDTMMMTMGDAYLFKITQGSKIETYSIVHHQDGRVETMRVMGH